MPKLLEAARNPLAHVAQRWTPDPRTVQRAALTALVMSLVIVVTGGAVRLTGSGLGCDTWPKCTGDSLVVTSEMGVHGVIEFGNRMLTYVLCAAVGWVIVAARSARPGRPGLTRLAWAQFWIVMGNAVLGGITVLTGLNPYIVAAHFLLATTLITVAAVTWQRSREGDSPPRPLAGVPVRRAVAALAVVNAALIVAGTAVTGTGPHAGDPGEIARMPFDWERISQVHAALAWMAVLGTLAVWALLRLVDAPRGPRARTRDLFLLLMSQGVIGYAQYFLQVPEVLVGLHMLGSVLVWVAMVRLLLSLRGRGPVPGTEDTGPPAGADPEPAAGRPDRASLVGSSRP
ncbi:COX15/CtaA family protein [Streptomyces sp. ACA25]|uniref:COX15/CtaA family protein n=1 Tax=Streptomyces sp. ACA25 TaxID=3022596 RepID=UPI00230779ED|nr:COX15/CtaA family protein [Streptomyces sp. ACA25]MDB1088490.1 COX15/CtaA family protein [Streptomyces sp. ACA25]